MSQREECRREVTEREGSDDWETTSALTRTRVGEETAEKQARGLGERSRIVAASVVRGPSV